jgi:hypothetical protein
MLIKARILEYTENYIGKVFDRQHIGTRINRMKKISKHESLFDIYLIFCFLGAFWQNKGLKIPNR